LLRPRSALSSAGEAGGSAETNGGLERTEELRREIEAARARLRESIRSQEG
jgi:hypothetical protein